MSPSTSRPEGERRQRRRHWVAPVGLMLIALAVVPVGGWAWTSSLELNRASTARAQAAEVSGAARQLVLSTSLPARLLDEWNWTGSVIGIRDLGFTTAQVKALTGLDVDANLAEAQARVDDLVSSLGLDSVAKDLERIRTEGGSMWLKELQYRQLHGTLAARSSGIFDDMWTVAGGIAGGEELVDTIQVLEAAAAARAKIAAQLSSYWGAQFVTGDTTAQQAVAELIAQRAIYDEALGAVQVGAAADSSATTALADLLVLADVTQFNDAIDELITAGQLSNTDTWPPTGAVDVDHLTAIFTSATKSSEAHAALVVGAANDVVAASEKVGLRASDETSAAKLLIVSMAAVALAFAIGLTYLIVSPLRRLAVAAGRLRDGEHDSSVRLRGPREVRQATEAINEAGAHLALVERQAKALGAGELDHPVLEETSPGALGASLQEAVRTLAASLTEREEFRRRLAHEAAHDPLTQIPNRKACLTELQRGLARTNRNHATLALMFLDLDGFKEINDRLGHQAGDIVLETTAQRLVSAVREGDHVGRLGGDEFIVIAEPVDGVAESMELAERLLDTVSEPIHVRSTLVSVDACIGVALAHETDLTADELLRDADLAVYKAKTLGRGRVELCDDDLRIQMTRQADLERALSDAIRNDELTVHYQPTVAPITGATLAIEALVRWERPGHGLLLPIDFIPLAERSDLIVEIDRWVLEQVAGQVESWESEDNELASVPIAVNIAGRHLGSEGLVANILDPLREHAVDPSRLILEVTENDLFSDLPDVAPKLHALRSAGVRVAIDDFGTGYTSLAHLRTLPVDILKIDHCFTSDGTAQALVKLIIDTGHLLGADITAEGVETSEQAELLTRLGSDALQGYLYGRPCPPDELQAQLLGRAHA